MYRLGQRPEVDGVSARARIIMTANFPILILTGLDEAVTDLAGFTTCCHPAVKLVKRTFPMQNYVRHTRCFTRSLV